MEEAGCVADSRAAVWEQGRPWTLEPAARVPLPALPSCGLTLAEFRGQAEPSAQEWVWAKPWRAGCRCHLLRSSRHNMHLAF